VRPIVSGNRGRIGEIEEVYALRLGDGCLETLRAILKDLSQEIMDLKFLGAPSAAMAAVGSAAPTRRSMPEDRPCCDEGVEVKGEHGLD
jgi:hypothetical protein